VRLRQRFFGRLHAHDGLLKRGCKGVHNFRPLWNLRFYR
jgi:hypothetical protein